MVTIPPVFNVVNQTKTEAYNKMISNLENATELYVTNNRDTIANINTVGTTLQITIQNLVDYGIVKAPINDPKTGNVVPVTTPIEIKVIKKNNYKIRVLYNQSDTTPPVITLIGASTIDIDQNTQYIDLGATATDDYDVNITNSITVNSSVNTSIVGTYLVVYNVSDSAGNLGTKTRTVIVHDKTSPQIAFSMNGNSTYAKTRSTTVTITDNGTINASSLKYLWSINNITPAEASFSSSFTSGGSVSTPAGVTGSYYLWILAKDTEGNISIVSSNIFNLDNIVPTIIMNGTSPITIELGSIYSDLGAIATDNIDSAISVTSSSNVNVNAVGTYTINYNASDSSGNTATTVTRTVVVKSLSTVEVLVVAGGGGGGATGSGGGGGAVLYDSNYTITQTNTTVTVGTGGIAGLAAGATAGGVGGNSVFGTLTVSGGGGGNSHGSTTSQSGGNGGGGAITASGSVTPGGIGTQGYNGGAGFVQASWAGNCGGGGGAGGVGAAGCNAAGCGNGGAGYSSAITGTYVSYGGGGGGGEVNGSYAGVGAGGGGNAVIDSTGYSGTNGLGGGGAGGAYNGSYFNGGAGGSGVVIIRYYGSQRATGGTITTWEGYTIHKFTSSGTFTVW